MTILDPGALMKRGRILLRARELTPAGFTVLDCLVFACRAPGRTSAMVSYAKLARLTGLSRPTVVAAIRKLVALRLVAKEKQGRLVAWGAGLAWRQMANIYHFGCELTALPVSRELKKKEGLQERTRQLLAWATQASGTQDLLLSRRRMMEQGGLAKHPSGNSRSG